MTPLPDARSLRPDWDTPKDGDFARYVERLSAPRAAATLDEPGRVPHASEMIKAHRPRVDARAASAAPEPAQPPLAAVLRILLPGLVLLIVLAQVFSVLSGGIGVLLLVVLLAVGGWALSRWWRAFVKGARGSKTGAAALASLQRELQALAQNKAQARQRK